MLMKQGTHVIIITGNPTEEHLAAAYKELFGPHAVVPLFTPSPPRPRKMVVCRPAVGTTHSSYSLVNTIALRSGHAADVIRRTRVPSTYISYRKRNFLIHPTVTAR